MSVAFQGAAQVVRPPEDGLPYLRANRAGELRLEPGELTVRDGRIAAFEADPAAARRFDARGCALVPGLVDAHTHLPFAGWRAGEYALKVAGAPYEEIARAGGGIASSARALAAASDEEILGQAGELAAEMLSWGTTAFECKSGYGVSREGELRALRLARRLAEEVTEVTTATALLAHAVPEGFTTPEWMDEVEAMLPEVVEAGASALDIYVESIAFSNADLARMGELARRTGLALRCHVEQFATHRSVPVALEAGARSVDHLACLHPDDVAPLARAECAALLLPGAELMADERVAPGRALADAGAICVVATDANPGTSPVVALPIVAGLAVRRYRWTVQELLAAITLNAAWVLGLSGELGSLEVGKRADVLVLDAPVEHLPYRFGHDPVLAAFVGGELAYLRPGADGRVA
jgi:imidazolonepropionase